jgi:hypothetical protein
MNRYRRMIWPAAAIVAVMSVGSVAYADRLGSFDFGNLVSRLLDSSSNVLFGFRDPVPQSSMQDIPRRPKQPVSELLDVAGGLRVDIFSRDIAHNADQLAFWPNDSRPTHAIVCIEVFQPIVIGSFENGTVKVSPSVQRIDLRTRKVETILRGLAGCDGIRRTPWQTILATEEDGSPRRGLFGGGDDGHIGNAFEILDPLETTDVTVQRGALRGTFFDAKGRVLVGDAAARSVELGGFGVAIRRALPEIAWEGIGITKDGVLVAGDELRPGTTTSPTVGGPDSDGGAIFKFVPARPSDGKPIQRLSDSPFVDGTVYAMRVTCQRNGGQLGQGCQKGNAVFVRTSAINARDEADRFGATGYYRPEDLDMDPQFDGFRFCFTNTGDRGALNFGEVLCAVDNDPLFATTQFRPDSFSGSIVTTTAPVDVQIFLEGDDDLNQPDNIAIDPDKLNVYVIEDNPNGDIFACLPDGDDRDTTTDGCVRLLTLKDQTAEPTGFQFTSDGDTAFFFIQHSADDNDPIMRNSSCPNPNVIPEFMRDDFCTDDMIRIRGFRSLFR